MKPDLFVPEDDYRARMDTLIERVRACPTAEGSDEVLIPGEPERRYEEARRRSGIPYSAAEIAALQEEAAKAGVAALAVAERRSAPEKPASRGHCGAGDRATSRSRAMILRWCKPTARPSILPPGRRREGPSMSKSHSKLLAAAGLLLALTTAAAAQDYPEQAGAADHPVPAGRQQRRGRPHDRARSSASSSASRSIVDNRAGAGGVVGTELAANAPKDGYTLLIISLAHAVNPWLYKLPYDPIKAFAPIAVLASGPNVLVGQSRACR